MPLRYKTTYDPSHTAELCAGRDSLQQRAALSLDNKIADISKLSPRKVHTLFTGL